MSLFLLLVVSAFFVQTFALQCVDHNNNPVDWFIVYKLPEIKHHHKLLKAGVAYVYVTSDNFASWTFANVSINSTDSIVAQTLKPFYENKTDKAYILYNDQPPNHRTQSNKGHTKGVVLADEKSGFWLIHSVPHFPLTTPNYIYPRTAAEYGQSFLCISLDTTNLNAVGTQLQYNQPEIYAQNIPNTLKSSLSVLAAAAINVTISKAPWFHQKTLVTKNGTQFVSFAKSKQFAKELYVDWVAVALNTSLMVETWPNGAGRLPSDCNKTESVFNVDSVAIDVLNVTFTTTQDHSKWAVSNPLQGLHWLCVGDINRMQSQKGRGGGTACINNKKLATLYQKSVNGYQKC